MMPGLPDSRSQLDFFPREVAVEQLDPRERLGAATSVQALFRVRWTDEARAHLVFRDRHGTYCQDHGTQCPAVLAVRDRA